jgi:hypothetical protein
MVTDMDLVGLEVGLEMGLEVGWKAGLVGRKCISIQVFGEMSIF